MRASSLGFRGDASAGVGWGWVCLVTFECYCLYCFVYSLAAVLYNPSQGVSYDVIYFTPSTSTSLYFFLLDL